MQDPERWPVFMDQQLNLLS